MGDGSASFCLRARSCVTQIRDGKMFKIFQMCVHIRTERVSGLLSKQAVQLRHNRKRICDARCKFCTKIEILYYNLFMIKR